MKISFVSESRMLPFIKVKFEGIDDTKLALIDSGSEITLLDKNIARNIKRISIQDGGRLTLDGFGGLTDDSSTGLFVTSIDVIGDDGTTWRSYIAGALADFSSMADSFKEACPAEEVALILGSDSLQSMDAIINYKQSNLECNDISSNKCKKEQHS